MNGSDRTPVKSVFSVSSPDAMMAITPQDTDLATDHVEEDLAGSFSALKVTYPGLAKRLADNDTVEGSPVNHGRFKRPDLNPTPLKYAVTDLYTVTNRGTAEKAPFPPASSANQRKLLVICSASEEHNTGDHQENALRTALLCGPEGCLRRPELRDCLEWIDSDNLTPAPLADLLRVHEYTYLKYLDDKCRASVHKHEASSRGEFPAFYAPPGMLDCDTPLQVQSLEAAKRFCGAAILAVDHVMQGRCTGTGAEAGTPTKTGGRCDRAFVIGRPPGHHAGPHGCVPSNHFWQRPDMASSGFCLLNTVAVAAAYARHQYGRWAWRNATLQANPVSGRAPSQPPRTATERAPRIAIVDIDIHHGNGTEDIVRNLSPRQVHLPLPSSWAPQTTLSYKPWLNEQDADEVFFSSVHLFAGERFYPCSGADSFPEHQPPQPDDRVVNIELTPLGPGPWDRKGRAKLTPAQRDLLCKQASTQFRSKVTSMLLPRIAAFNPDLIFISAGFDAHYDDFYHFLTEQDLHWVTEELCSVAGRSGGTAGCAVISVLEGGYSLSSPIVAKPPKTTRTAPAMGNPPAHAPSAVTQPVGVETAGTVGGEAGLGRGGRQKAKKGAPLVAGAPAVEALSSPEVRTTLDTASTVAVAVKEEVRSPEVGVSAAAGAVDAHSMYAQRPGDGGLVKGVLAHAAALVGRKAWVQ